MMSFARVRRNVFLLVAVISALSPHVVNAQSLSEDTQQHIEQSLVRVNATIGGRESISATGFIFSRRDLVVTALHAVVNDASPTVGYRSADGKTTFREARVIRILPERDLALLQVTNPLDRIPAEVSGQDIGGVGQLFVVGFPFGIQTFRSRKIDLASIGSLVLSDNLDEDARRQISALGFPSLSSNIVPLNGGLLPGDSGAPILDHQGHIHAIGNGGLRTGYVGLNWGVPASVLPELLRSEIDLSSLDVDLSALDALYMTVPFSDDWDNANGVLEFRTSFESFENDALQQPLSDFVPTSDTFDTCFPLSSSFTSWRRTEEAYSGRFAISLNPQGNPQTGTFQTNFCRTPTLAVSASILNQIFDLSGQKDLLVSYFAKSRSNPIDNGPNGCDSSLNIYASRDDGPWEPYSALCGSHSSEAMAWEERRFRVPGNGARTIKLAFVYSLQNSDTHDPDAQYLIDDFYALVSH